MVTMVARGGASRSMLGAATLVALGALSASALGRSVEEQAHQLHSYPHRVLQAQSTIDFISVVEGTALIPADQQDGQPLQGVDAENVEPPTLATSLAVGTANNLADYQLYFVVPDTTGATGYTVTFVGKLDGAQWSVDIWDFSSTPAAWFPAGTLTGITTSAWGTATIEFTGPPANYQNIRTDSALIEVQLRVSAAGATVVSGLLDYAAVELRGLSPSPTPAPMPVAPVVPVDGVTASFIATVTGTPATQEVDTQLANAEGGAVGPLTSVTFQSTTAGAAKYEIYFSAPATVTGGFTITLNVQLGTGATADHWKIEMLDFNPTTGGWVLAGFLTGATSGAWTPIVFTIPSISPTDFVSLDADRDYLVRVTTTGATGAETIYLDQAVVGTGPLAPTPAPAPSPIAPTGPIPGIPNFVEKINGEPITQTDGTALVGAEGEGLATNSVEFKSISGLAKYEIYTTIPNPSTGDLTISVTARLEAGATAANWGVSLYNFETTVDDFTTPVPLTGLTTSFSTVDIVVPATATSVYELGAIMLIRVMATDATGAEAITVDAVSISAAATTPTPTTPTPTPEPTLGSTDVQVDLVPCFLVTTAIIKNDFPTASAYLMNEFFKGFWTATQIVQVVGTSDTLDLLNTEIYGKCSVVYVGVKPSTDQKIQLDAYGIKFKARIVYFNTAATFDDTDFRARLGVQSFFAAPLEDAPRVKFTNTETNSVVPDDMLTDPLTLQLGTTPVIVTTTLPAGVTIKAEYADESGTTLPGPDGQTNAAPAIVEFIGSGALAGLEELHIFFEIAWFDMGSWAWGHYLAEWGTRGIFQGERRFYLGAVVDDLFLTTGQWVYTATDFEGPLARCSGADLEKFQAAEAAVNTQYGAQVKTEHAFNGIGILDKVNSAWRDVEGTDSDIALLPKGQKPDVPEGIAQQLGVNWLSRAFNPVTGVNGMAEDEVNGDFDTDDLLARVQADLGAFYWQSHTLTHLARDNLGANDCDIEDGGNAQMAVLFGFFDSDNYNWRSMTSPGITGLFNSNCLQSGANNLMKCYPGDNTFDGVQTTVSLVNLGNQFHSLTTTVATNGLAGSQIVPRYATNVYFNCVTGECLINENEHIRRTVCDCSEKNPALPQGTCALCTDGNTQSFNFMASTDPNAGPLEKLYQTEEQTTTRYILSGRRDKYMFHQANVVSTTWAPSGNLAVNPVPTDNPSLLEYWYERVLAQMSKFINTSTFPIKTLKFDNLCANFYEHEDLDGSGAVLTAKKDATGAIIDMTLATSSNNGAPIPLTIPTADAASISTGALVKESTETYGADTTYIFAAGTLTSRDLSKPATSELAAIPQDVATVAEQNAAQTEADNVAASENPVLMPDVIEAKEDLLSSAAEQGFVIEGIATAAAP